MGAPSGRAAVAQRARQKQGAWTRKKLRRLRLQREQERGIFREPPRRRLFADE